MTTLNDLKENRTEIVSQIISMFGENNLKSVMTLMVDMVNDAANNDFMMFQPSDVEEVSDILRYIQQNHSFAPQTNSDKVRGYVAEKFDEKAYWNNKLS
jgi:hypothetical protein